MLRFSWLLTLLALATLSSAFNFAEIRLDGIEAYLQRGQKRQATGTGNTSPPPVASSTPPPPSSPQPTPTPPPASTPPPNSPPPDQPSSAPPNSSPAPSSRQNTPPPRSSAVQTSAGPESSAPRTTPIVRTSFFVSTSSQVFTTKYTTESNGSQVEVTSTGVTGVRVTGQATVTDPPTSQSNDGKKDSGLSDSNKKVIGGVVGGVGGALLLGGIALVFWRMKKRQHKVTADDDDLTLNTGAALGDKSHNNTGASPFQSNLEQYHNPGGRPNAAANF